MKQYHTNWLTEISKFIIFRICILLPFYVIYLLFKIYVFSLKLSINRLQKGIMKRFYQYLVDMKYKKNVETD
jgi:hypothetical protein